LSKILFHLMITIVFIAILLTIATNTPFLLNKLTGNILGEHNITYSNVKGDLVNGITAHNVKFNNKPLASKVNFSWSPISLLDKKILIHNLVIDDLDKNRTVALIESFETKDKTSKPMNFEIIIQKAKITIVPFSHRHYKILRTEINTQGLQLKTEPFELLKGDIRLNAKTNYGDINYDAKVAGAFKLIGSGDVKANQTLYTRYKIPLDAKNISYAKIEELNVTKTGFTANLTANGKKILLGKSDNSNLDVTNSVSNVIYDFAKNKTIVHSTGLAQSFYAPNIKVISDVINTDGEVTYTGSAEALNMTNLHPKLMQLLANPKIKYSGDANKLDAIVDVKEFKGTIRTIGFDGGDLLMKSKQPLLVKDWISLPTSLQNARGVVDAKVPIIFKAPIVQSLEFTAKSDIIDAVGKATVGSDNVWIIDGVANVGTSSILRKMIPNLKWEALALSKAKIVLQPTNTEINIDNDNISAKLTNQVGQNTIVGNISVGSTDFKVNGDISKTLLIETNTASISNTLTGISKFFAFESPALNGDATLRATINNMQNGVVNIISSHLSYGTNPQHPILIDNLRATTNFDGDKWVINNYELKYENQRYFSTKASSFVLNGDNIFATKAWINDQTSAIGVYNVASQQGNFHLNSSGIVIPHRLASFKAGFDIDAIINKDAFTVKGDVRVIDGEILYHFGQKTFASDSDIITTRDVKTRYVSPFMDNLSLSIKVKSYGPVRYRDGDSNFLANIDIGVEKMPHSDMMVLGMTNIPSGGNFYYKGKKFTIQDSNIYFSGNIEKPMLELKATYIAPNHKIRVIITGTPGNPIVNFSSTPKLTKEQILALIMFDSEVAANNYSGDEMMKMMGGAMAKSLLSDMGINFDHLVLGAKNSIEVGKRLNGRTTLIYANEQSISRAKIKYDFSKSLEGVVSVSSQSSSADILYKREFKSLDPRDKNITKR